MADGTQGKVFAKPLDAAACVALSLVFGALLSAFGMIPMPENIKTFVGYAAVQIAIIAVVFVYFRVRKLSVSALSVDEKPKVSALALTPVMACGAIAFLMIINYAAVYIYQAAGIETSVAAPAWDRWENVVLSIITMCILPAIGEELLFRGAVLGAMRRFGDKKAVIISAVVFAFYHFNLAQTWYQLFYGAFLAYVVVKTDNVWYSVALHFCNNLFVQLLALIPSMGALDVFGWANLGILFAICLGGAGILSTSGTLFFGTVGKRQLKPPSAELEKDDKIGAYSLVGGLAVLWVIMIILSFTGAL